ncbi:MULTISPECIES: DUF2283 domain-containing protein [Curtobacterium]|uniref:DUF2283 domain-containing protein n=1 Tax=Curtobacterium flaccumfaciens TaxID=2035 RepID=UPI00310262A6
MHFEYDAEADAVYLTLGAPVGPGEAVRQVTIEDGGIPRVIIDYDADDKILGFEILDASRSLRSEDLGR